MTTVTASWVGLTLGGGRYRVTAQLGEGGMGSVYRARDHHLDCEVVIKVPRRSMLEEAEFAGRFAREIRSLVKLAHPNIVKVTDVGEHDGLPFAVMQYLAGGSLRDRQRARPDRGFLPMVSSELSGWLPDVAAALDFMHEQRYIHRDVKPDNILFDGHGHAYLSDFGIAKVLAGKTEKQQKTFLTATGMVLGTPQYMAPELVMGRDHDGRVDQYALAVTVYEMLCGQVPFNGPTAVAIFLQQSTQPPPSLKAVLPSIPTRLAEAVQRALAKDPKQRFANCSAFAEAIVQGSDSASAVASSLGANADYARAGPMVPPPVSAKQFCAACGKAFLIPPAVHGGRVQCPTCGAVVEVAAQSIGLITGQPVKAPETGGSSQLQFDTDPDRAATQPHAAAGAASADIGYPRAAPTRWTKRHRVMSLWIAAGLVAGLHVTLGSVWLLKSKSASPATPTRLASTTSIRPAAGDKEAAKASVPSPTFALRDIPEDVILTPGQSRTLRIRVERQGHSAPIQVQVRDLPAGIECHAIDIPVQQNEAELKLVVPASAESTTGRARLEARSEGMLVDARGINLSVNKVEKKTIPAPVEKPKPAPPLDPPGPVPRIKEMRVGEMVRSFAQKASCVAYSRDGRLAVSGSRNGTLCAWEPETGRQLFAVQKHAQPVWGVAVSPTASRFASASEDGTVRLWELPSGQPLVVLGGRTPVLSVGFSPDGRLVFAGCKDGTVRVWQEASGADVRSFQVHPRSGKIHSKAVNSVALSPDGRWLLTGSGELQGTEESLRLWNFETEKLERVFEGYTAKVNSVAFGPDGQRALSGGADGTVRLWNVASGEQLLSIKAHNGYVHSVAFSPDGQRALSGGIDSFARLWDLASGTELFRFEAHKKGKGSVFGVAFSPDGRHALSVSEAGGIYLWALTNYRLTGGP